MKCIGLLGGVSWVSTLEYYKRLNLMINKRKGKNHSAKIVLYSFDFEEILAHQKKQDEAMELRLLQEKLILLDKAGSDVIAICSNTTNKLASQLDVTIHKKLINIIDATGDYLNLLGAKRVGLIGTRYTMEQDFYKNKLLEKGLQVVIPDAYARELLHQIIYDELCHGIVTAKSKEVVLNIIKKLASSCHLDGVILGCTELPLLVSKADINIPLFDTIEIHINAILTKLKWLN
ncbi:amino acid racemase [Legionella anisa]|uniref:Aspartate racemase n=1 Tax=Legionella anisa TaxID=28082 RepID=A0AAX0WQJ3_9GAMM|nr:amino acid racemase [Legionella anisa]AWN73117.1 amino acid racemase [Legionella anisa]KTC67448.1 Aspartate racemase [Legionella anisa]MBN5936457.1 amino acid racemase [Legionella anisa]MCW8423947.1 amino acid racemase [Legionella anisa]MCW8447469.1 amino acid racemase [Legionella anisa]